MKRSLYVTNQQTPAQATNFRRKILLMVNINKTYLPLYATSQNTLDEYVIMLKLQVNFQGLS
ncbi:hypothetical protein BCU97_16150 [Vibrio splendidus]|nr:hypothetical protein BCU97_16150 [Vibrio splendidus]